MRRVICSYSFLLTLLFTNGLYAQGPQISSLSSNSVAPGAQVTIYGTNFGSQGTVTVGNSSNWLTCTVSNWSDGQVQVTVPVFAESGWIYITTQAGAPSNEEPLTVLTPNIQTVTSSPSPVLPGGQVTIQGTYFGNTPGTVTVGNSSGWYSATVSNWSPGQVVATVPVWAQSGWIYLTTAVGASSNAMPLTIATPYIQTVTSSPSPVLPGGQVTIQGTYFGNTPGTVTVGNSSGWYSATVTNWSDGQVQATVPVWAQSGLIYLTTAAGAPSNWTPLTIATPNIQTVTSSPSPVLPGGQVTIQGTYFGNTPGTVTVGNSSGWYSATVTNWSDGQVVATVPVWAQSGWIYLTTAVGASSNATPLTVATPSIQTVTSSPSPVLPGGQVSIQGTYFGNTPGTVTVGNSANWYSATVTNWSDGLVQATVPVSAQSGWIYITTAAGAPSNWTPLTIATPNIQTVTPGTVAEGGVVIITGANFGQAQGTVTVGNSANWYTATVSTWSDSQVVVNVPNVVESGSIYLTTAAGAQSNRVALTIAAPPAIAASASPAPNSNGWNNSPVTVSFSCTAGGFPIVTCPSPQTVSTEGANQAVTGIVVDAGGNSVPVTVTVDIDMTPPAIAVSAPADMTTLSQSPVTVTGSASDALSGTSQVTCGGTAATLADSAFSCSVSLNVGLDLIVIKATDEAGNVSAAKLHLDLAGTLPAPNTLTVTPTGVNMLVGGTQQFNADGRTGPPAY